MSCQMIIRINSELKEKVSRAASADGKTTSDFVCSLLDAYVRDLDMGAYVDGPLGENRSQARIQSHDGKECQESYQ